MVESLLEFIASIWDWWEWLVPGLIGGLLGVAQGVLRGFHVSRKIWLGLIMISLVAAPFVAFHKIRAERDELKKFTINEDKIQIGLQYAYEWDNYRGSKNSGNPHDIWRMVIEPIKRKYSSEEMRLLLGVINLHDKLSIKNIEIGIIFHDDLQVRNEKHWSRMLNDKYYFTSLPDINPSNGKHSSGSLWIKFPKPGAYNISCEITGEGFRKTTRKVEIILY